MTYQLDITRNGNVTATIQGIQSRRELARRLADNIRNDRGTAHITITVRSEWVCENDLLYKGTVEGLKGKKL